MADKPEPISNVWSWLLLAAFIVAAFIVFHFEPAADDDPPRDPAVCYEPSQC